MKKLEYSPDAIQKIQEIEYIVRVRYGDKVAGKVKKTIVQRIQSLKMNEKLGVSMKDLYGVTPDYRKLYVAHNHVFYLLEEDKIRIVKIYNEKEDYMYKLFGIRSVDDESDGFWDEIEKQKGLQEE